MGGGRLHGIGKASMAHTNTLRFLAKNSQYLQNVSEEPHNLVLYVRKTIDCVVSQRGALRPSQYNLWLYWYRPKIRNINSIIVVLCWFRQPIVTGPVMAHSQRSTQLMKTSPAMAWLVRMGATALLTPHLCWHMHTHLPRNFITYSLSHKLPFFANYIYNLPGGLCASISLVLRPCMWDLRTILCQHGLHMLSTFTVNLFNFCLNLD